MAASFGLSSVNFAIFLLRQGVIAKDIQLLHYLASAAYYSLHECRLPFIDETTRSQAQTFGRAWRAQCASGARARIVVPLWGLLRCAGFGASQVRDAAPRSRRRRGRLPTTPTAPSSVGRTPFYCRQTLQRPQRMYPGKSPFH